MKHIFIFTFVIASLIFSSNANAQFWQQTNGPGGANIKAVEINSQGHIFVASNTLMRSTNDGASWSQIGTNFVIATIADLKIGKDGTIFMLIPFTRYQELWRSLDNGDTWQKIDSLPYAHSLLSITPDGSIFVSSLEQTYSRSTDNGNSWTEVTPIGPKAVSNIWGDKVGHLFLSDGLSLYRSTDNGQNWGKIINGLSDQVFSIAEAMNGDLYAGIADNNFKGKILYKSIDGGRIWTNDSLNVPENFARYGYQVIISPQGRIVLYADNLLVVSDDNGKNWHRASFPFFFPNPGQFSIGAVSSAGIFYMNHAWTLFHSQLDSGSKWTHFDVPNGNVIAVFKHPNGNLLANDWLSTDDGKHWTTLKNGGITSANALDSLSNLLEGSGGYIFRSQDGGITFTQNSTMLTQGEITAIDVHNHGEVFASSSTEGIFRSIDNGQTWDQLNVGITDRHIFSLAVHQNGDIYAGSHDTIYKSTDIGLTWQQLNTNFPPQSGNITGMVVSTQGNIIASIENVGIYWSTDNGTSWSQRAIGLNASYVYSLISTPSGKIFAATDVGVFYLDITPGANWTAFDQGLTATVISLCRDQSGRLFAGTYFSGVFSSIQTFNIANQDGVSQTNISAAATSLGTNYPNPFTSSTTIPFTLGERSFIELEISDVLGRSYATLTKGNYNAGNYEAKFNADNLSAGMYFIRLRTEKENFTKSILITK